MQISTCTGWTAAYCCWTLFFWQDAAQSGYHLPCRGVRCLLVVLTRLLSCCWPAVLVLNTYAHCSCPACRWMASDYRRPLLLEELLGYNADILCLQEVDEKAFRVFFGPQFWHAGGSCAGTACQHCCTAQSKVMPHSNAAACQHRCAELSRAHLQLFWPQLHWDTLWPQTGWCLAETFMF